jgi:hypothetical protein
MPQLDLDLFEDFIFFAFISLLFISDEDSEESVIAMATDSYLAQYYFNTRNSIKHQANIVKVLFVQAITKK